MAAVGKGVPSVVNRQVDLTGGPGAKNIPRRVFLGLLGGAAVLGVAAPVIQGELAGSLVGGAVSPVGYQIYTVSAG